ncbi:STAS domain-containing protein [Nocardia sp. NBC_00511]|uniref:STAS domain-containing protein n=1 Tax=Nocardia sp. NBC_00511 TaxID=2903591 RepID=UPI0030E40918
MHEPDPTRLLQVHVDTEDPIPVLTATGEVDLVSAPVLERALRHALEQAPRTVVLDLSQVTFFASVGIAVLITATRSCPEPLRIVAPYPVRRPLEVTGVAELFALCDSLDTALTSTV